MTGTFSQGTSESSARRYADFIDSIPAAVFRTTIEGKIIFCNTGFAQIFGYSHANDLIGFPVINLYRNKKDRGVMVHSIMQRGVVTDLPIPFVKVDATPIWCAVTARAVLDDDGIVIHLDGIMKDITHVIEDMDKPSLLAGVNRSQEDIVIIFDMHGKLIDINEAGTYLFGFSINELLGKPFSEFLIPIHREHFMLFLSDILKLGTEEIIFTLNDKNGDEHHIECYALLVKRNGKAHHIKCIVRDITEKMKLQKDQVDSEKFQGVLEMAGGVAHRLNQPLTIINNLLNEVISDLAPGSTKHEKIVKVQNQIKKLNEITKKIGNIKKYEAMDYVAGVRIVDIDKAS